MDEKEIVIQTVEMISQLMGELEAKAFEEEGFSEITMSQMLYLETINHLGQPTFGELADKLGVTRPSVSAIIKRLTGLGFVKKVQSQVDRRVFYINLTEQGNRFNELHGSVHRILAYRITEKLSQAEIEELAGLLNKITSI